MLGKWLCYQVLSLRVINLVSNAVYCCSITGTFLIMKVFMWLIKKIIDVVS